ncbi:hypothetical protein BT96DRAFT_1017365 [Gymnopus androsaceus JB14]|uniref:Uncharacterized protein n=1 Tax=Gymnopus androsaceus JB14 TaxID=1447944 RepID=A0A6A4HYI3_9AGAR|nr:hypothetical protein BT96DRAFT_1017365 [Gymnopus androsaceus JB14]
MASQNPSQLMRRFVAFKGSRHSHATQQPSTSASPIEIQSENVHSNPNPIEQVSTYRTNFLGLFSGDGETPIAATVPPKLTDFVPPINVHPDEFTAEEDHSEPPALPFSAPRQIEDFNYVGGWGVDENGEQRYVEKGRIEEVEDEGSVNGGTVASRLMDAMTLPAATTPPPGPSLRTRRELPHHSPLVPENHHRFQHTMLAGITHTHTPVRFASPLSQSASGLPPLRGFSQYSAHNSHLDPSPSPLHMSFTGNSNATRAYEPLADSLIHFLKLHPLDAPASAPFEALAESIASLSQLNGFHQFSAAPSERIVEEEEEEEPAPETPTAAARVFEALGNSLESLGPQAADVLEPIIVPQHHSTGNDERIIEQNLSAIEELSKTVESIRLSVFGLGHLRNVQPHLNMCENIAESLSRVRQTLMRRRTLPQEHWSHLSMTSRSKYESRLFSLQRCLRRLSDMSKRIVEPSRLDMLLDKLNQHYEKLTNVADKLDDTYERLKLRHLYMVASKLTEEANRTRSTYMSAREMYVSNHDHKKSRAGNTKRSRARRSRPQSSGVF